MPPRLIIVDDSRVARRLIERSLDGKGIEIAGSAGNGVEALELFRTLRPELVTMDITMPEMDGLTCIEEILTIDPDVRILIISSLADEATASEARRRGALGFLTKPFTSQELDTAVGELLARGE